MRYQKDMRIRLTLMGKAGTVIPLNYQYPMSAAIYKILDQADGEYAQFLHDVGYGKGFKLFTFSDLQCRYKIDGDRFILLQDEVDVTLCFQFPRTSETFIRGIFLSQQIVIADKRDRAAFRVKQVEVQQDPLSYLADDERVSFTVKPVSPIVCGEKNEKGHYVFLDPQDKNFSKMLWLNWVEKVHAVLGTSFTADIKNSPGIQTEFYPNPPRSRLIAIKSGAPGETRIRGYVNFKLKVTGIKKAVDILLNAGAGLYNAQGMGCVEVIGTNRNLSDES